MDQSLIIAFASFVAAIILGAVLASVVRRTLGSDKRPSALRDVASAIGSLVFWTFVAIGIVVAVGISSPETLSTIPPQLVIYLPRALVAGLFVIVGKVLGVLGSTIVGQAVQRATGQRQFGVERGIQSVAMVLSMLLALTQLGIDTAVLNMFVAGMIGAMALAAALIAGLGGRDIAAHIAAGRSVRRFVEPGARLESAVVTGEVLELHPVTVQIRGDDGSSYHVPYSELLNGAVRVSPSSSAPPPGPDDTIHD